MRPGYNNVRMRYPVDADTPRETLGDLCAYMQRTSPVLDIIRNPVPVSVELTG